jgi:hypothetical protein
LRRRKWRSGNHYPYPYAIHDAETDEKIDKHDLLRSLLIEAGIEDGQEFSIAITPRLDFDAHTEWRLVEAHKYERRAKGVDK